jgi:hypothetical protein
LLHASVTSRRKQGEIEAFSPTSSKGPYCENAVIWKGLDRVEGGVQRTIAVGRMKRDPTASNRARRR